MGKRVNKAVRAKLSGMDEQRKADIITQINKRIDFIINELTWLQREKDEESLIRLSDLTQERDRLMNRLEELNNDEEDGYVEIEDPTRVGVGKQVVVDNGDGSMTYSLVSEHIADTANGEISPKSPLGQQLVNRKIGDTVEVKTPGGMMNYTILDVM